MSNLHIQASFNSGEWAPTLYARVDLAKYKSGAALLENFFVDYRGGASTRPGTKYILQCYKSNKIVRLIPFQASFDVGYVLEFGDHYIRFFFNGAPVLFTGFSITAATKANPCVLTIPGNDFLVGDWFYIAGVSGMTELNNKYFNVTSVAGDNVTISDLNGVPIDSTTFGTYVSGGVASWVYTINSPYADTDLKLLKFAQNVNDLILCHPAYPTNVLSLVTATNWTLNPIVFGSTAVAPTGIGISTTLTTGPVSYSYVVTSVDANGQESLASNPVPLFSLEDIRTTPGTNSLYWPAVPGAVGYNVYKAVAAYQYTVPVGASYGFIGYTAGVQLHDTNIAPDFTQSPPISTNPFQAAGGSGVNYVTITNPGTYTAVPTVSFIGVPSDIAASGTVILGVIGTPTVSAGGTGHAVGDRVVFTNNVVLVIASVSGGVITAWEPMTNASANPGQVTSGTTPANPLMQVSSSGTGTGAQANVVWGVVQVQVLNHGAGYTSAPTVSFSSGTAAATAVLSPASNGYPSVPGFFQQRLVLAAPNGAPQTFYMSQPGAYYNFNVSSPVQATDAITGALVSGQLNTIKAMIPQTSGLLILTERASWLVNGGSNGSAVSPSALVANAQSFNGISDVPPIVANFDILYVQAKGSIVRDSAYNIYANVFTGTDISVLSSHLFYDHTVVEWAWAEEPFKVVWAVRDDGVMLTLTFLKEQEFIGWSHSITAGKYKSVASVVEQTATGQVDAIYNVTERIVNGFVVKYIERNVERQFPGGVADAWCVDAGLRYEGPATTTFSGAEHLAGLTVTGLADGQIITPFVMPLNGSFTLPTPASKVTIGIGYTCDLQTLAIDIGDPTIQGKVKKISDVDVRVSQTLGLEIGSDFNHLTPMKDLIRGNVSKMLTGQQNQIVTDLVDGDANTVLDPTYTVPGQYCIRQSLPYPATILGVIPNLHLGETDGRQT